MIEVDVFNCKLNLLVVDEELVECRKFWLVFDFGYDRGYVYFYI